MRGGNDNEAGIAFVCRGAGCLCRPPSAHREKEKVLEAWMADTTSEIDSFGTTRTEGKVHIGLRIAQSSSPIP